MKPTEMPKEEVLALVNKGIDDRERLLAKARDMGCAGNLELAEYVEKLEQRLEFLETTTRHSDEREFKAMGYITERIDALRKDVDDQAEIIYRIEKKGQR